MARQELPLARRLVARSALKRAVDLLGAIALAVVLSPLLLLIALLIYIESGAPVFFRQTRAGLDGRHFTIFKFRTMTETAPSARTVWTQRNDVRVTRLGGFLRRTSLDELPQILNVLVGQMSLVGPRPHPISLDEEYWPQISVYGRRFEAKPGITGLAQINDHRGTIRSVDEMRARVDADAHYVETWTLWLDFRIMAKTLPHLVASDNAY